MAKNDRYPQYPDTFDVTAPIREPIAKMAKMLTEQVPVKLGIQKITPEMPEYWGLAILMTDEEAELCLAMGIRSPKTFPQIVKISPFDEEKTKELLDHMAYTGALEYNWENERHEKQWTVPVYVPGSCEFTNMNEELLQQHPELALWFNKMAYVQLETVGAMVPPGGAGVGMHVIPVEKAIGSDQHSVSVEHISHWLDKYEGKYAASPCSCRTSRRQPIHGEGCGDDPEEWCIAVGDMADYIVETGKSGKRGGYISKEEVLEILQKAEDNGFVHQITNIDGENKIFAICNCNVNVCYALRTSQLFNTPNMSRSAYVARVSPENCVACGRCVEVCPAGAVRLGQKLCKADGTTVAYPKHMLPTQKSWSEDDWDWDYLDHNRRDCYDTGTAPCKTACPAHIAIQGYLQMAKEGRYQEALALIKQNNPLPAVCGHVCNKRCEDACTRGSYDESIAIDDVKRFIAEQDLKAATRYIPKKVIPKVEGEFEEKVAIIGAGPAGLTCAFYLAKMGYSPTIFEKNAQPGGMLTYGIPSFVMEKDLVMAEIDVIKAMGVEIRCGVEVGKDVTIPQLREEGYKAFYLGIGCQGGRRANIPGEDALEVLTAVEFLHESAPGVAYPGMDGKDVVVIGGGNVAVDVARTAVRSGAKNTAMYCLEQRHEMPAKVDEIVLTEADGVGITCGWGPKEILKDSKGHVKGIVLKKCLSVFNEKGRFAPTYDEDDVVTLKCNYVVLSVGQAIEWGGLLEGSNVQLNRRNGPLADEVTYQTSEPDIFVGGDVYTGPKFAIDAIAAGKQAAISMHRFVQPGCSLTLGRDQNKYVELDKNDLNLTFKEHAPREKTGVNEAIDLKSFHDRSLTLTEEQVKRETERCFSCGQSVVDEHKCIGCGVCTTRCEFDAIHLYRERPACSDMYRFEDRIHKILPNGLKQAVQIKVLENEANHEDGFKAKALKKVHKKLGAVTY